MKRSPIHQAKESWMRAFALDGFGQPGSIHDLPDPEPAEKEVRVRVTAASINPFDNAVLQGYLKGRMEHRFPLVPCGDLAGTVDALGAGVDGVVIVGASGGIGSYAVQLAAATGARVIGVTSKAKTEYVKSLGAHEVIDRTSGDVIEALKARHPDGVAAIIDTGSDAAGLARLSETVRKGGAVTSMKGAAAVEDLAKRGIKGVNVGTQVTRERLDHLAW